MARASTDRVGCERKVVVGYVVHVGLSPSFAFGTFLVLNMKQRQKKERRRISRTSSLNKKNLQSSLRVTLSPAFVCKPTVSVFSKLAQGSLSMVHASTVSSNTLLLLRLVAILRSPSYLAKRQVSCTQGLRYFKFINSGRNSPIRTITPAFPYLAIDNPMT